MSIYTQFVSNVAFPCHELLKGHSTRSALNSMEKNQWLSPEELEKKQLADLRDFLHSIGVSVPFYRELFKSLKFDPQSVRSVEDLQRLPLMGKAEIREATESLKSDCGEKLQPFNTGGSSGEPLNFFLGNERVSHDVAAKWRATRWWGVDIGDPEIVVWGSPIELGAQDRLRILRDKIFRTELLSAFEMSDTNLERFIDRMKAVRPRMLFGYPSSLALISDFAQRQGVSLSHLGVRVAFVTSERLYDHQREIIERVFGCPVANGYGGRDLGFIAHECPSGNMHITADDVVLEVVDEEGQSVPVGTEGELVVTHLRTRDFPFVRYRSGDRGVLSYERCECGRGLPILKCLQGRSTDFVRSNDGTSLHGLALIYVLRELSDVESFKIEQVSLSKFTVKLVISNESARPAVESRVCRGFKERLGNNLDVNFEYLPHIPPEKSGKYRYVVSHVQ